jgi:mannose-6-phosphate isomerase
MDHSTRPWGSYEVLAHGERYQLKRIVVLPGRRLSYQRHARRAEHWFVVAGQGEVLLDGDKIPLQPGDAIDIPVGAAHRMSNPGASELVFIEVQTGSYFGEDDIVRLEDDFGRV